MKALLTSLSWCLVVAFPLLVLVGVERVPVSYLGAAFAGLAALRLLLLPDHGRKLVPLCLATVLLLVAVSAVLANDPAWFRLYPVAVNLVLLLVFASSLWRGPPVIERLARMGEPELAPAAVSYTRKVTIVWCAFFCVNGAIALYTAVACSMATWAWYNGAIAYVLMGLLFGAEWLLRQRVKRGVHA